LKGCFEFLGVIFKDEREKKRKKIIIDNKAETMKLHMLPGEIVVTERILSPP
jgi:hypothetical protein